MSHEIYEDVQGFAHFAFVDGQPGWHNLGQPFPEGTTPTDAFKAAGAFDVRIEKQGLYRLRNGVYQPLSDNFELVRMPWEGDPEELSFGVVGKDYEPLQNEDIAAILDKLGKYADVSCVGLLKKGAITFATFRADYFDVLVGGKADQHQLYLLYYEDKRSGHSILFILSPVRTVCMNTARAALQQALYEIRLNHNDGAKTMVEWTADFLAKIASGQKAIQEAMQHMADTPMTDATAEQVIDYAWPQPPTPVKVLMGEAHFAGRKVLQLADSAGFDSQELADAVANLKKTDRERWDQFVAAKNTHDRRTQGIDKLRQAAKVAYHEHPTQQDLKGTAFGAYNAVTFAADHFGTGKANVKVATANLNGDRVIPKIRAWTACTEPDKVLN